MGRKSADAHAGKRSTEVAGWELSEQERPREGCRFRARCPVYHAKGSPAVCRKKDTEPELVAIGAQHRVARHFPLV